MLQHRFQAVQVESVFQGITKGELEFFPGRHGNGLEDRHLYGNERQRELNAFLGFARRRLEHGHAIDTSGKRFDADIKIFVLHPHPSRFGKAGCLTFTNA
jgi:hypothetical protein